MLSLLKVPIVQEITKDAFLKGYKEQATPVIMQNITKDWPARKKWSMEYFESLAANKEVKLYDSKPSKEKKLQHAAEKTMPLREYFQLLREGEQDLRMFFFDILREIPSLKNDFKFPEIGLRFFKKLPVMFIAGNKAKVQMHFDIDYADIFLCHFGGKKKVILFPPQQTPLMYHVPYSFSSLFSVDYENPDYEKYPALWYLKGFEAELHHGDVLYVPPGWWHFISYEEIGFSMAIRAFPRDIKNILKMLRNLLWTRTLDAIMRKLYGQKYNEINESLAVENTHKYLKKYNALKGVE